MWNDKSVLPDKEYDWGILVYYKTLEPKFLRIENYDSNDPAGVEKWAYQKDIIQLQEENNRYKRALEIARKEYLVVVENWARILCDYRPQRIQHYIIEYRAEYDKQINKILKKD